MGSRTIMDIWNTWAFSSYSGVNMDEKEIKMKAIVILDIVVILMWIISGILTIFTGLTITTYIMTWAMLVVTLLTKGILDYWEYKDRKEVTA